MKVLDAVCSWRNALFTWLALSLFILPTHVLAQQVKTIELGNKSGQAFSFHGITNGRLRTFASDNEARGVVKQVLAAMGLPLRFEVRASAVGNAAAILQPDGTRLILYNTLFIDEIRERTGRYWSLISIMAHEIGHHLAFHLQKHIADHEAELEADYFSGYILARMGATKDDALAAIYEIASEESTKTHPGRKDRLQAITAGWKNGKAGQNVKANVALASIDRSPAPATIKAARSYQHQASPRDSADACVDNIGMLYCVSSYLPTSGINRSDYGPASLFDNSDRTAWVEGRTAKRDDGIGEWILLDWKSERRVRGFTFKNGYWKSKRHFRINGRVTKLRIRLSTGRTMDVAINDIMRSQDITLDSPETATWAQIEIIKARRGTKYSDTAVTELAVRFE
jgi:hypothetical protein